MKPRRARAHLLQEWCESGHNANTKPFGEASWRRSTHIPPICKNKLKNPLMNTCSLLLGIFRHVILLKRAQRGIKLVDKTVERQSVNVHCPPCFSSYLLMIVLHPSPFPSFFLSFLYFYTDAGWPSIGWVRGIS